MKLQDTKFFKRFIKHETKIEKILRTEDNLQIKVLRFAELGPFTVREARDSLNLSPDELTFLNREIARGDGYFVNIEYGRYMLNLEGKSRLLEYDEMILAQRNSREAKWLAIFAILISIAVGAVQMWRIQEVRIVNEILPTELTSSSLNINK